MRNLQVPGRSPVHSTTGMVATSHSLASQAAIDVLKQGGNAMDAAIAACAVQCVVEPQSTGIGGDCFAMYAPAGKCPPIAYNGSGRAPAAATVEKLREMGVTELERTSPHAVVVPGAVDAWCQLNEDHGSLPLATLLQPAIAYARNGYPVSSRVWHDWTTEKQHLQSDENLARIFLPSGNVPEVGDLHRQPELANSLELIAHQGREAFYSGALAKEMVSVLRSKGGLHTLEDFAETRGNYVAPLSTDYNGKRIHECPPNGQGIIALLLMNMMSNLGDTSDPTSANRIHLELEACRRAYAARSGYVADPDLSKVPVKDLLSHQFAEQLVESINSTSSVSDGIDISLRKSSHHDTVYISIVDKDRNCCSFINTLFWPWGTGITTPSSGIVLTNRGQGFVLEENHPNAIAPRKRPLHTIIPAMVSVNDRVELTFGVMGGEYQAMGHMQFLTKYIDYGMDIQEAQDAPRFMVDPFTGEVEVEETIPQATVDDLESRGHRIGRAALPIGGSQAISINWENGVLTGGSDPRKDGCAIGGLLLASTGHISYNTWVHIRKSHGTSIRLLPRKTSGKECQESLVISLDGWMNDPEIPNPASLGEHNPMREIHLAAFLESSNTNAPLHLAKSYRYGFDVPKDGVMSAIWYRVGLERLDGEAAREMAGLLANFTEADLKVEARKAARFYRTEYVTHSGDAWIATRWALVLMYGLGTGRNQEAAFNILEEVVYRQPNFGPALCLAGLCYYLESGVNKCDREAYRLLRRAAGHGSCRAMFEVGRLTGAVMATGGQADAALWYRRSALLGNAKAQRSFARCRKRGIGIGRSQVDSIHWLHRAAEQGQPTAQRLLGQAYHDGLCVEVDREEGTRWLRRAAAQGSHHAGALLQYECM